MSHETDELSCSRTALDMDCMLIYFQKCPLLPPNNDPPLRDGRTVGEERQPDQPAGRTIPILSMQNIPGYLSIAAR